MNPGNTPASPKFGRVAAKAAAIWAMLFALTAAEEEFPLFRAEDKVFLEPSKAKFEFVTGEVTAGLGIGFKIGFGETCGGLILLKEDVGDLTLV